MAGIVKPTIICRSTSSGTAKYLSYQAITEKLLDVPKQAVVHLAASLKIRSIPALFPNPATSLTATKI